MSYYDCEARDSPRVYEIDCVVGYCCIACKGHEIKHNQPYKNRNNGLSPLQCISIPCSRTKRNKLMSLKLALFETFSLFSSSRLISFLLFNSLLISEVNQKQYLIITFMSVWQLNKEFWQKITFYRWKIHDRIWEKLYESTTELCWFYIRKLYYSMLYCIKLLYLSHFTG